MEEMVFYNGPVTVTSARLITPGKTYALSGVTAVGTTYASPRRLWPIVLIGIGIYLVRREPPEWTWGIGCMAAGIAWLLLQRKIYHVRLESASGAVTVFSTRSRAVVMDINRALNEAIAYRG